LSSRDRQAFNARWLADVNSSFRRSVYDDLAQPRAEDLTELSIGITRSLSQGWEINGTVSAYDSESIEPFSYERRRFALGVNRLFFKAHELRTTSACRARACRRTTRSNSSTPAQLGRGAKGPVSGRAR
jgi:hypothetical protein